MPPEPPRRASEIGRGRDDVGDRVRFEHIREAARDAITFAAGRSRADLDTDALLRRGLLSCIQEIGEAAARMTAAGRARAADLPWGQIVATRHILVHAYFRVDLDILWDVIERDLSSLIASVDRVLVDWPPDDEGITTS